MSSVTAIFQSAVVLAITIAFGFFCSVVVGTLVAPRVARSKAAQEAVRKLVALGVFVVFLLVFVFPKLVVRAA